jgi:hypothetical protein
MSITVVQYKCSNPASVPLKQAKNNAITNVPQGMPQKFRYADGGNSFSLGRSVYTLAPQCHSIIKGNNPFTSIRVDSQAGTSCNKIVANEGWSTTKIVVANRSRNALYSNANERCCENGKMTIVSSADEYIERKKNRAIGKGSSTVGLMNKQGNNELAFRGIATQMTATQARRKVRNSGYVVPPKCRGGGGLGSTGGIEAVSLGGGKCGQPTGWDVTPLFHGRPFPV